MQATPIAATIIALAESLGLDVIAEGMQTADQCTVLARLDAMCIKATILASQHLQQCATQRRFFAYSVINGWAS